MSESNFSRACSGGAVVIGVLGELEHKPNKRIFRLSDGTPVSQLTVTSLLRRGLLKVISDDGPRRCFVATALGRSMGMHARVQSNGAGRGVFRVSSHPQRSR
jgi:hypothetical protein